MPFASFKNIQKRNARLHKERSQPAARAKFGPLPKKKDFILRSRDEEAKRNRIRELKRKALTKNEDEFYFAMHNTAHSEEKGHILLNNTKEYSDSELVDMLSCDILYLQRELTIEMSKIRELESRFNLLPADPSVASRRLKPKRTVFVESIEEARAVRSSFDPSAVSIQIPGSVPASDADALMDLQAAGYKELSKRLTRAEKLKLAIAKREAKATLMRSANVKYKVIRKGNRNHAPVYKFEQRRYK
ncbi:putative U3 small nucleolar RNA-associated protein 11 [Echinococcus granulosus]|uniref:U3 small nucleolar RNA-associated protein 11 n=1 Tax=Echinococcus granulosus TaxID=6210 RepID=A0A068WLD4_ECHGR|nr:putative U3 small nucleolar RNA-associated protein 11 [Echinococcus granulosus]CDS20594.1 Proto oncogene tyrosine protein kinase FYN [Echinococcus granulosus]